MATPARRLFDDVPTAGKPPWAEAEIGSISPAVREGIAMVAEWMSVRHEAVALFWEDDAERATTRDLIVRHSVLEFAKSRTHNIPWYEQLCNEIASRTVVKNEISLLADKGLLVVRPRAGRAGMIVYPSRNLCAWYEFVIPIFIREARRIFHRRSA